MLAILSRAGRKRTRRWGDGRVIHFACPGCKSVLSGRDEQASQIVICPKCGQRMKTPQPPERTEGFNPRRTPKTSRRPLVAAIVVFTVLLLASMAGGIWLLTRSVSHEAENANRYRPTLRSGGRQPPESGISRGADAPRSEVVPASPKPVKEKPAEKKPPQDKPIPPPIEDNKEIDLVDDLPPELSFDIVDAINIQREKAGVPPIFLDAEVSSACQSHAEHLARHAARLNDKSLSPNDRTETIAAEAPLAAVEKWLKEPARRAAILEPRLRTFGAGLRATSRDSGSPSSIGRAASTVSRRRKRCR